VDASLAALAPGGRLLMVAPFARDGLTPRAIAQHLAAHLDVVELRVVEGHVCFAGTKATPDPARWQALSSAERLAQLTEEAAFQAIDARERTVASLEGLRREQIARLGLRARAGSSPLRSALDQSARLRQALERTRRSARYQVGRAVLDAKSPVEAMSLPKRLWSIYRTKAGGEELTGDTPEHEALVRTLDLRTDDFTTHVKKLGAERVVIMCSGTSIKGLRGNRPWMLTKVLRARGIPVVFGYEGPIAEGELPVPSDPGLLELPAEYLAKKLGTLADVDLGVDKRLFWLSYPTAAIAPAINRLNVQGWVTVYDSLDDWEEFARVQMGTWYSGAVERFVVQSSDFTTAVSRPLQEKLRRFAEGRPVLLSPNAWDPRFLVPGYARRPGRQVKIGYFGHLTPAWFDWSSIRRVARARPDWRFEIIGHGAPVGLDVPPNVALLGPKPPDEIAPIAAEWSAALIPFLVGPLADAVDPIKVYEYLALGLPVVSFRMPQIADYPYVTTVNEAAEMLAALDRALSVVVDQHRVRAWLAENTWEVRVHDVLAEADRVLVDAPFEKTLHAKGGRP
ncbi:glycosyltransferase, partial [Myxococcota bacterium]|nr:glycosyltransferase [Myxococcota bacterium]